MARPRSDIGGKTDSKAVRERLKDKSLAGWQRQRLQAILLACDAGRTLPEIASEVGTHRSTLSAWLKCVREHGLEGLLARKPKGKGPESWLDEALAEKFRHQLRAGHWRRAQDARVWLEQHLGKKLSLFTVYKYLGKCAARLKVPRPTHAGQKPAAVETFRQTLRDQLHGKNIPLEQNVHLWVIDEMRFGLQPVTRRMWTLKGVDLVAPVHPRYQWGYTYGGLEICDNRAEFLHTDGVSQEATAIFYAQLAASDPEGMHIIIADGAGFHLADGHEKLPANVRVITLPAYSPELNPIEKLWDLVKDRICNRVWADLEQLRAAIDHVLAEFWTNPARVRSLLGHATVPSVANTSARTVRRL
jgi:transposase